MQPGRWHLVPVCREIIQNELEQHSCQGYPAVNGLATLNILVSM